MDFPDDHGIVSRAQAVQAGHTDGQLHRQTRAGELRRLHRGAYMSATSFDALDSEAQHVTRVRAAVAAQRTTSVVSHQSAALLLGLPLWNVDLSKVHLTQTRRDAGRKSSHLHVHCAAAESVPTVRIGDLTVTGVARTVFDLACTIGFEQAVVVADAALKRTLTTRDQLLAEAALGIRRWGHRRAAEVIAFADGRSESVGESRSRVGMLRAGMAMPDLQCRIFDPNGYETGRTDFGWLTARLLGEFDGKIKYGRLLKPGETADDVYFAERARQDALHDLGYEMVRWIWSELSRPDLLYPRIQAALDRAVRLHSR